MEDTKKEKLKETLEILANGGRYYWGPISGNLILLNKEEERAAHEAGSGEYDLFLDLKEKRLIEYKSTMSQGHYIFHGRVDTYKISKKGQEYYKSLKKE